MAVYADRFLRRAEGRRFAGQRGRPAGRGGDRGAAFGRNAGRSDRRRGGGVGGTRSGDRPTILPGRSARRDEGIRQPQRRVHGQYRADRGRRAGARRRARAGARRLPMPAARPAPGRARLDAGLRRRRRLDARSAPAPAGPAPVAVASRSHSNAGDRGGAAPGRLRRAPLDRLVAEILPGRGGRGGFLSAARADHGMGHRGGRRGAARRRRHRS